MKKYVKAEKSLLDNVYVDRLVRDLQEAATKLNSVGGSVRDMFDWGDNQYHDEVYSAISPVLNSELGISVEGFTQYCWDLTNALMAVAKAINNADKQFRNRNNGVK